MLRTPERDKHIVNVSAVEEQFYRKFKTPIIAGFNTGEHIWGKFLKDYAPTDW